MRELVITLEYDRGTDPVMDVFIEHPDLVSKAVDISLGVDGLTRVDRFSGPSEAMDAVYEVYVDPTICNECATPHGRCNADREYDVVDGSGERRTVYTYHEGVTFCNSIPYYAGKHLESGLLFDSWRRGDRHEWRIFMRNDQAVGEMYDELVDALPDGVTVSFQRLTTPERWGEHTGTIADLPPEQRTAIEAAVGMDYYETPRGATLADLAEVLDVPQSTLRYRLRRAEAWLTNSVIAAQSPARPPDLI